MKSILLLGKVFILFLFISMSFSFSSVMNTGEEEWTMIKSANNVEIMVKAATCEGADVYLFKVVNNGSQSENLDFTIDITTEPAYGAIPFTRDLKAGEVLGEDCTDAISLPRTIKTSDFKGININFN